MYIGPGLKLWRSRKLKKMYPDGKISKNFRYKEFYCRDGTPIPVKAAPDAQRHILRFLEPMRAKFGTCHVLSGYRHKRYNDKIPGAVSNSQHIWDTNPGTATDLIFARGNPQQWAEFARDIRRRTGGTGGIGTYSQQGFVHVDSRPIQADWSGK